MDPLTKIFELIEQLITIRGKRRRDVFSEILEPIFHELEKVNVFYRQLFRAAIAAIPVERDGKMGNSQTFGSGDYHSDYVPDPIVQIKQRLLEGREKEPELRDQLRTHAIELLKAIEGKKEKRFLVTVIFYFLEGSPELKEDLAIDSWIEYAVRLKGIHVRTPASYIAEGIQRETNPVQVRLALESVLETLARKFQDVNRTFISLKLDVLIRT